MKEIIHIPSMEILMAHYKKVYLYSDTAICCAGKTWDYSLQEALFNPDYQPNFQSRKFGETDFPVAVIDDSHLSQNFKGSRIENILTQVLEQIKDEVESCLQNYGSQRVGLCIGSCDNGSEDSLAAHRDYLEKGRFPQNYHLGQQSPAQVTSFVRSKLKIGGPAITVATACASSATAVIEASQMINAGFCDAVIVVGIDIVSPTVFLGFNGLEAVSPTGCNPFSKNRRGITLGEAAAALIVCRDKPNTENYVKLLGFGESADANHMTAPLESGEGAVQAMEQAITMAEIDRSQISYINLHGTGTPLNDAMEGRAIARVFSQAATGGGSIKVSSTKAITGHTLGAAGCLELSICMRTLYDSVMNGLLPIHHWDGEIDSDLPSLQFVEAGNKKKTSICMTNSFAFGGCNTSIVIAKE